MTQTEAHCSLFELPQGVLCGIVEQCGPREKWALFLTCQSGRRFILEAAQQISGSMELSQLAREWRLPSLLRDPDGFWLELVQLQLEDASLSGFLQCGYQLRGIKHLKLKLVGLFQS
jgi:hypothetical protein